MNLVFATDAGNYLAGITVRIADQQGSTLVETASDGPILMVNLPAGTYTIEGDLTCRRIPAPFRVITGDAPVSLNELRKLQQLPSAR